MQYHITSTVLWSLMVCLSWTNIALCLKTVSLWNWRSHQWLVATFRPWKNVKSHDCWWLLHLVETGYFLTALEYITFLYWFNHLSDEVDVCSLWQDGMFSLKSPGTATVHGPSTLSFLDYCWGQTIMVEGHDIGEKHTREGASNKIRFSETHPWWSTTFTLAWPFRVFILWVTAIRL